MEDLIFDVVHSTDRLLFDAVFEPIGATFSDIGNKIIDSLAESIKKAGTVYFMDIGAQPERRITTSKPIVQLCSPSEFSRYTKNIDKIEIHHRCYRIYEGIEPDNGRVALYKEKLRDLLKIPVRVDWSSIVKGQLTVRKASAFKDDFLVFSLQTAVEGYERICLVKKATTSDNLLDWTLSNIKQAYDRNELTAFNMRDFNHPPYERLAFPQRPTYIEFLDSYLEESVSKVRRLADELDENPDEFHMNPESVRNKKAVTREMQDWTDLQERITLEKEIQVKKQRYQHTNRPVRVFDAKYKEHLKTLQEEQTEDYMLDKIKYHARMGEARTFFVGKKLGYSKKNIEAQTAVYSEALRDYWTEWFRAVMDEELRVLDAKITSRKVREEELLAASLRTRAICEEKWIPVNSGVFASGPQAIIEKEPTIRYGESAAEKAISKVGEEVEVVWDASQKRVDALDEAALNSQLGEEKFLKMQIQEIGLRMDAFDSNLTYKNREALREDAMKLYKLSRRFLY